MTSATSVMRPRLLLFFQNNCVWKQSVDLRSRCRHHTLSKRTVFASTAFSRWIQTDNPTLYFNKIQHRSSMWKYFAWNNYLVRNYAHLRKRYLTLSSYIIIIVPEVKLERHRAVKMCMQSATFLVNGQQWRGGTSVSGKPNPELQADRPAAQFNTEWLLKGRADALV